MAEIYEDKVKNIFIKAQKISIGRKVTFGESINIRLNGDFSIGDRSHLGNNVVIRGNNVSFGKDLFHSQGLSIGDSGYQYPTANLVIGDRCTIHNNEINIFKPVSIGNDVGLSPDVKLLTHGYWLSVLKGYPAKFSGITIKDGAIIGYRSLILMGVTINERAVIAAQSVVTRDVDADCIYGGNPAKLIKKIVPPSEEKKLELIEHILSEYKDICDFHSVHPRIICNYPLIYVNDCVFNVEKLEFTGEEDAETDDFRDYVRKWGLRFYSERPFRSIGCDL